MSRRVVMAAVVMALALAWSGVGARAQTGRVIGKVVDSATGKPVAGARLVFKHATMGLRFKGESNAEGSYRIVNVRYGDYEVEVMADGYATLRSSYTIEPLSRDATVVNVTLSPGS